MLRQNLAGLQQQVMRLILLPQLLVVRDPLHQERDDGVTPQPL